MKALASRFQEFAVSLLAISLMGSFTLACSKGKSAASLSRLDGVQSLSVDQIRALGPEELAALSSEQIQALTPTQVKSFDNHQIYTFPGLQFSYLTPEQIASLEPGQYRQVHYLNRECIESMSLEQMHALTSQQLATLSSDQLSWFSVLQLGELSAAQLGQLRSTHTYTPILGSLTNEQVNVLIPQMSWPLIQELRESHIRAMPAEVIDRLTREQMRAFSVEQLQAFTTSQLPSLVSRLSLLSQVQQDRLRSFPSLSGLILISRLPALTAAQVIDIPSYLYYLVSPDQIQGMSAVQLRAMGHLTSEQTAALSFDQLDQLTILLGNSLADIVRLSFLSPQQIGALTRDQFLILANRYEGLGDLSREQKDALSWSHLLLLNDRHLAQIQGASVDDFIFSRAAALTLRGAREVVGFHGFQIRDLPVESVSQLQPTLIGALNQGHIRDFSRIQLQALTDVQIKAFKVEQIPFLTSEVLAQFTLDQISYLTKRQLEVISTAQCETLRGALSPVLTHLTSATPQQLGSAAVLSFLGTAQIASLAADQIRGLTKEQIENNFSSQHYQALTPTQLEALSVEKARTIPISLLSIAQLRALPSCRDYLGRFKLSESQTRLLTVAQLQGMSGEDVRSIEIGSLEDEQFDALSREQIQALNGSQVPWSRLSQEQWSWIAANQIPAVSGILASQLVNLSPEAFPGLKVRHLQSITSDILSQLSDAQVNALTRRQISLFTYRQISEWSDHALARFSAEEAILRQQRELHPQQFNSLWLAMEDRHQRHPPLHYMIPDNALTYTQNKDLTLAERVALVKLISVPESELTSCSWRDEGNLYLWNLELLTEEQLQKLQDPDHVGNLSGGVIQFNFHWRMIEDLMDSSSQNIYWLEPQ